MAGEERVQVEKLLADLDRRARELADAELRTRTAASEQELLNRQLGERLAGIDKERKAEVARVRQEGQRAVADGRRALEAAIREVRTRGADQPSVVTARDRLAELEAKVQVEEERRAAPDWTPEVGSKVRIPHLNLVGVVLEVRGQKLVADAEGLRLTLGLDAVRASDADAPVDAPRPVDAGSWSWQGEAPEVSPELDLRGERAVEGWERLDRLIDRAIPAGLKAIHVIHGFGTGRLREYLYVRLKSDPRVASFREAPPSEGGGGATQVTLSG